MSEGHGSRAPEVLLLPGWHGSGPGHWQRAWESVRGYHLLDQTDWAWPRRGDWMARLEEVVRDASREVVLVAHSLGCHLVAHWATHSRHAQQVARAMLVAPPDIETEPTPPQLTGWRPTVRTRLPFPSLVVASSNDRYATLASARHMAQEWGSSFLDVGPAGHINAESNLGDWPAGLALLDDFIRRSSKRASSLTIGQLSPHSDAP